MKETQALWRSTRRSHGDKLPLQLCKSSVHLPQSVTLSGPAQAPLPLLGWGTPTPHAAPGLPDSASLLLQPPQSHPFHLCSTSFQGSLSSRSWSSFLCLYPCSSMILSLFLFPGLVLNPETLSQSSQTPDYSLFPNLMLHFHTSSAFAQDVPPLQVPFLPMACPKALEKLTHPSWPSTYPLLQRQNRSFLPGTLCHTPDANRTCARVMKDSSILPC